MKLRIGVSVQLLAYQQNRRYVFEVVISQQTFVVHIFDHSDVTSSPRTGGAFRKITGLPSHDAQLPLPLKGLGFDTSLFKDGTFWDQGGRGKVLGRSSTVFATFHYWAYVVGHEITSQR